MKKDNLEIATQYALDIINSTIPACLYVQLACKRFISDLNNSEYYYNKDEVDKVISFINSLDLTEQVTKTPFLLAPWQTFIICSIYGITYKSTGYRVYKYAYIELPRKNGKSQLISALAMYHLIFENDSQVVISANSREQAKNVDFKKVKQYCQQLDIKQKYLKQYYSQVKFNNNELLVTASDSSRLDGYSCSVAIVDELHAAKNGDMYNVLKSSQGSRQQPLLLVITTAGENTDSFCYKLRESNIAVLTGQQVDRSQFTLIYTLDESDDFTQEKNWYKANPNLDVSIYKHFLESEVNKAVTNPIEKQGVLVKNFNVWTKNNSNEVWLEEDVIMASLQSINIDDFIGEDCVVGIDLASISDITAVSYCFIQNNSPHFFNYYYLPEDSLNTLTNKKMYRQWSEQGYITLVPGNVTDYNIILTDLLKQNEKTAIANLLYDKYNATQFAISCTEAGLNLEEFAQGKGNFNRATKEFTRLILSNNIIIEDNPVTHWMLNNAVLAYDYNENCKPIKVNKSKKIDGVIAMLQAFGGTLERGAGTNIY